MSLLRESGRQASSSRSTFKVGGRVLLLATLLVLMVGTVSAEVSESWEDGSADNWFSSSLNNNVDWQVVNSNAYDGSYSLEGTTTSNQGYEHFLSSNWGDKQDGKINVWYKYGQTDRLFGVVARSQAQDTERGKHYWASFTNDGSTFYLCVGDGSGSHCATKLDSASINIDATTYHRVKLQVEGNNIDAWLYDQNENQIAHLSGTDSTYSSGYFGIAGNGWGSGNTAYYDKITISSLNTAPSFDSVSTQPSSWTLNSDVNVSTVVSDGDGTVSGVSADVWEDGTQIVSDASLIENSGTWEVDNLFTVDEFGVEYEVELTATDDDGATSTYTTSQVIDDSSSGLVVSDPVQGELYSSQNVPYSVQLQDDGDDVPGESATCDLNLDGSTFTTVSLTEGGSGASGSFDVGSDGDYSFSTSCSEDQGDPALDDVSRSFTVDTGPPSIQILNPVNRTNSTTGISLEYTVSDPNLDSSSCKYSKDGGTNISISSCGNTTIQYGSIGSHNVTVYASDTLGNTQGVTQEFFVDNLNTVTAEDAGSGTSVQSFQVSVSNGTDTIGGSTSDGSFQFYTSEVPEGSVNVTVSSDGYQVKTQQLSGVNETFDQDLSFSLERAGFSVSVFDEQTGTRVQEPVRMEIRNSTTTEEFFWGNRLVSAEDRYSSPSKAFDQDKSTSAGYSIGGDTTVRQSLTGSVSLGTSSSEEIFLKYYYRYHPSENNVWYSNLDEVELETSSGSFESIYSDSAPNIGESGGGTTTKSFTVDNSQDTYTGRIRVTGEVSGDNDYGGESFDVYEVWANRLKAPSLDYPNYPTDSADITVDDNSPEDRYRERSYVAELDENAKINLRAYLLENGQGLLSSVEVRGPEDQALQGALVTVQRFVDSSFRQVAQGETGSDGSASFYLDPDAEYRVQISSQGYESFTGSFSPANYQYDPLIVRLGSENDFVQSTEWDSIEYRLSPDVQNLNLSEVYEFNWSVIDSEASVSSLGIRVKNESGSTLDSKLVSGSPSGGSTTLEFDLNDTGLGSEDELVVEGFFVKDQQEFVYQRTYNLVHPVEPGVYSITSLMSDFEDSSSNTAQSFLALIFTLMVGTGLKSRIDAKAGGMISLLVLGLFTWQGWFDPFIWMLTALALIGIYARR